MKLFSIEEANALLPIVRGILQRIKRANTRLLAHQDLAKKVSEAADTGGGGINTGVQYAATLIELTDQTARLGILGVQLKDFTRGLVDFPSMRDGRVVLLCWQLGEGDQVEWWHDIDAGFAGRTPL